MEAFVAVVLVFMLIGLLVPVALVIWSRRARMYSGSFGSYDGPLVRGSGKEAAVASGVVAGRSDGAVLSDDERASWEELTRVSWNL